MNKTVTVINTTPYKEQPVPEVGKEYHIFDDGKVRPSRHSVVVIDKVIPFAEAPTPILETWKHDVEECYWLFASETDYFVKATDICHDDADIHYFVRTTDGGWFSMGFWASRLDINGSMYEAMCERIGLNKNFWQLLSC